MKAKLFNAIELADIITIDGFEIDLVNDIEHDEIRLESTEDDSWVVCDQEIDIDKEGRATVQARLEGEDTELPCSVTFLCEVPLPLVYSSHDLGWIG